MSERKYFGTDGIRGKVGDSPITPDFVLKLGWAAGTVLARHGSRKIIIGKVNVDENSDLPSQYGIRNIPTILFFKGGEMVNKLVGAQSKAKLQEEAQKLLD